MAIKIPSKNIYEMNNPKIRDNVIDNVSVEQTIITQNNEYEVSVYNQEPFNVDSNDAITDPNNKDRQTKLITKSVSIQGGNFLWAFFCSHTEYNSYKKSQKITIKVPKIKNNSFVSKIYYGANEDGNNNIKYSLYGTKKSGTVTANLSFDITTSGGANPKITNIVYSSPTIDFEDENYEIPKKETFVYEGFVSGELGGTNGTASSEATLYDSSSLLTSIPYDYIENDIEYYCIDIDLIVGVRIVKMGGAVLENNATTMSGTYEEYIPKQMEITIYGNTIGIDLTDGSVTYGSGNKPHSLSGNELLQDSGKIAKYVVIKILEIVRLGDFNYNVYFEPISGEIDINEPLRIYGFDRKIVSYQGKYYFNLANTSDVEIGEEIKAINGYIPLTKHIATNVLTQYAKGKETATIRCSISDYYDESGNKIIDINTDKMSFRLHDEVMPYVYGANGIDVPMSKNKDGAAKVFEVVGSNIIFDGAIWQELTLLEKNI